MISYGLAAALGKEIEGGAPFDLTILAPPQIDALVKQGKIAADTRTVLAKSGMGVMVRTGAPKPDVSTVDAFKKTLLGGEVDRLSAGRPERHVSRRPDRSPRPHRRR